MKEISRKGSRILAGALLVPIGLVTLSPRAFASTGKWHNIAHGASFNMLGHPSIAVDREGDVFVTSIAVSTHDGEIAKIKGGGIKELANGSKKWTYIPVPTRSGMVGIPTGFAVDSKGNVFVSAYYFSYHVAGTTPTVKPITTIEELQNTSKKWKSIPAASTTTLTLPFGMHIAVPTQGRVPELIGVDGKGDLFGFTTHNSTNLIGLPTVSTTIVELHRGSKTWVAIPAPIIGEYIHHFAVDRNGDVFVTTSDPNFLQGATSTTKAVATGTKLSSFLSPTPVEELKQGSKKWAKLGPGLSFGVAGGIAVDTKGDVFVLNTPLNPKKSPDVLERQTGSKKWTNITNGYFDPISTGLAVGRVGHLYVTSFSYFTGGTVEEYVASPSVPGKPSHKQVTGAGWLETWNAVSGATGYNVYVNGTKMNARPVTSTRYTVTGEEAKTTYTVTVTAVGAGGESAPSPKDRVTTLQRAPGAPAGLSHSNVTQTGWTETWSPVSRAAGYYVRIKHGSNVTEAAVRGTRYAVTNEKPGATYDVQVIAVNASGGNVSSTDRVTTIPGAPTGLSHSGVTQTDWTEMWSPVSGATGYNVYLGGVKITSTPVKGTRTIVSGQNPGTAYDVTVRAVDEGGNGPQSTVDRVVTLENAPKSPTGLSHSGVTQTGWVETWSSVSGATGYNVYIGDVKVTATPVKGTSYIVSKEISGHAYTVTVQAVNAGGESAQSTVDSVTTLPVATSPKVTPPTAPTLSGLSLSSGALNPMFSSGTTSYTASVLHSVTNLTVTPTVKQSNTVVTVNGAVVTSGSASGSIALRVGNNPISVKVTEQSGQETTQQTYTINVTRAAANNGSIVLNPSSTSIQTGQSITVTGVVYDAQHAPIPNASVTLTSPEGYFGPNGSKDTVTANGNGVFTATWYAPTVTQSISTTVTASVYGSTYDVLPTTVTLNVVPPAPLGKQN